MAPRLDLTLDMIGLVVADMPTALEFYRSLGFDIPAEADAEQHVETTGPGGLRLAWDTQEVIRSMDPGWEPPTGHHRVAFAFRCADPAAVDHAYAELVAAGAPGVMAPWDAPWGQRYAVVHDPDGNSIDLFAPLS